MVLSRGQFAAIVALLVFLGIAVTLGIVLTNTSYFATPVPCDLVPTGEEIRNGDEYIGIAFASCPTDAQLAAFQNAASKWSAAIVENRVAPVEVGAFGFDVLIGCSFLRNGFVLDSSYTFDHLLVVADIVPIDGQGGTLAQAATCSLDDNEEFPVLGGMLFDESDLAALERKGQLETVILHEMGHALGFGPQWRNLLQDPIFASSSSVNRDNVPLFVGSNAVDEYNGLRSEAGASGNAEGVPVEDGRIEGEFMLFDPVSNPQSGRGSIDSHWKIETFGKELMVYAISGDAADYPLSSVTLASLADLGYGVDLSVADDFSLTSDLEFQRKEKDSSEELAYLVNDIATFEPPRGIRDAIQEYQSQFGGI